MRIARFTVGEEVDFGVVEGDEVAPITGHPFAPFTFTGYRYPLSEVRLLAPIIPSKVVAVGKNYADHAEEMGGEIPFEPIVFLKPSTAIIGTGDAIVCPPSSHRVDFEGELGVVIGRISKDVRVANALEHVLGYTCANDVTARDQQAQDGQWSRAKGYDTFCPLGPWIETQLDPSDLGLTTTVNGEVKQQARTSALLQSVPAMIAYITSVMTLLPGDVVLTGTPAGVGPLHPGDEVAVSVEGLGTLTNRVVARD
ncbi:MAG: fumarylacetoacetate hydrolase family protein [Actinomycetota bacterium]|nr:fumarylacetoacetate hydrolase family protein [Actinomycetota bacterium]